ATLGSDIDKVFAEAGIIDKRLPLQADSTMRKKINEGELLFVDHHLSHTAEYVRAGTIDPIDVAILEAVSITEDGMLIPTTSIGTALSFAKYAKSFIIDIDMAHPESLEGLHD